MKAKLVQVIRTETVEGDGKKKVQYIAWKDTGLWRENSWLKRYIWESNKYKP